MSNNLFLPTDVKAWLEGMGEEFFKKIGFKENQVILDFGSRVGNYTIPIAKLVGEKGKVYAIDVDHESLDELEDRANYYGLRNIHTMKTEGELEIDLPSDSIDGILFYDVIYSLCRRKGLEAYDELLTEFHRILKSEGTLTILFAHLEALDLTLEEAIKITTNKFEYIGELKHLTMHWNDLKEERIHIFKSR